jgi:hypothetical protein
MWQSGEYEFIDVSIRGKQYDAKMFKVQSIKPPTVETPYWEIEFEGGIQMLADDTVTISMEKKRSE